MEQAERIEALETKVASLMCLNKDIHKLSRTVDDLNIRVAALQLENASSHQGDDDTASRHSANQGDDDTAPPPPPPHPTTALLSPQAPPSPTPTAPAAKGVT
jgi:hypothetical protein